MSDLKALETRFTEFGGAFLTRPDVLAARLASVRGLVFDWDGVFNAGVKGAQLPSTFNEADAMGTNLLRYALWRRLGDLPACAIVTGEDNPAARAFAERERFHCVYQGVKNKVEAVEAFAAASNLEPKQITCMFDDVNDLSMAAVCGVRVLVRRSASPLLLEYVAREGLCDYVTGHEGGRNAVREAAELLIGLLGELEAIVASRVAWDERYRQYLSARQALTPKLAGHG